MTASRIRAGVERVRFSTPAQAGQRSLLWAALLVPFLHGSTRAYDVDSAAEIVPMARYQEFLTGGGVDGIVQLLFVVPLLAVTDAVGRIWYATLLWVPEGLTTLLFVAVVGGFWLLCIDFGWQSAQEHKQAFQRGETA